MSGCRPGWREYGAGRLGTTMACAVMVLTERRSRPVGPCEAARLRREAPADAWRGADALPATAATQALRAAGRLRRHLARRGVRAPSCG